MCNITYVREIVLNVAFSETVSSFTEFLKALGNCYGKIYWFLRVFVWDRFIRKLSIFNHFQFIRVHSSSFILVSQKIYIYKKSQ